MHPRLIGLSIALTLSGAWILLTIKGCVATTLITHEDVERRQKIHQIYNPEDSGPVGYYHLSHSYLNFHILKKNGMKITSEMLDQEEIRIDGQAGDSDKLRLIKEIFGSDLASYRKVFVAPSLADRLIHDELFLKKDALQKQSFDQETISVGKIKFNDWRSEQSRGITVFPKPKFPDSQ